MKNFKQQQPELIGKVPPHNSDIESALLQSLMEDGGEGLDEFKKLSIEPEMFYVPLHSSIYKAIIELDVLRKPISFVSVAAYLKNDSDKTEISVYQLMTLVKLESFILSSNVQKYRFLLIEFWMKRQLIKISHEIIAKVYSNEEIFEVISESEKKILDLTSRYRSKEMVSIAESMKETLTQLVELRESKIEFTGVPTGFEEFDKLTGGWQPGDLIVIGARPSTGKTFLALNLAYEAAKEKYPVGFFSLEMTLQQLNKRILANATLTSSDLIKIPYKMSDDQFSKMMNNAEHVLKLPIFLDDTSSISFQDLRSKARRLVAKQGVKLIVVDYLQLMQKPKHLEHDANKSIGYITENLKKLAKELNVPIILLSQLSRDSEKNARKPNKSDLRDSGSIEADADMIMLLYKALKSEYEERPQLQNAIMINFDKNRNGATDIIPLWPNYSLQKFYDYLPGQFVPATPLANKSEGDESAPF